MRKGARAMSSKELQNRFRDVGESDKGQRPVLVRRYEKAGFQDEPIGEEASGEPRAEGTDAHAIEMVEHKGFER